MTEGLYREKDNRTLYTTEEVYFRFDSTEEYRNGGERLP